MKKSPFRHLKNKWVIALVIIIGVIVFFIVRRGNIKPVFETATTTIGNVIETVSVTGTVSPVGKADLAFEKSGVISRIYVKVGDQVKKGDTIAALDDAGDRAAVASAQATLADMARNLTPAELAVQETAVVSAQTTVSNATHDAINAAHDAYLKAQSAIYNGVDVFFNNPQTSNPVINIRTDSSATQLAIDNERLSIGSTFSSWASALPTANNQNADLILAHTKDYLMQTKSYVNDISVIVSAMNTGNTSWTQAQISAAVATVNTSLTTLNAAIDAITAAQSALSLAGSGLDQAQSAYNLKLSGNSSQSIAAQAAKVAQARAILAQDTIVSPIDGIVTKAAPNVGEFAAAGASGFAVQDQTFKVEAYVPEADIAKVAVGDLASSTLDAYGSDTNFPAKVTMIDPAETVLEGVPTYKVTLQFIAPDARIRSGMTSNLEILTHEHDAVLTIPYRAVQDNGGTRSVRILAADGKSFSFMPVTTGLKGSNGTIEVLGGISAGQKVVTYVK